MRTVVVIQWLFFYIVSIAVLEFSVTHILIHSLIISTNCFSDILEYWNYLVLMYIFTKFSAVVTDKTIAEKKLYIFFLAALLHI